MDTINNCECIEKLRELSEKALSLKEKERLNDLSERDTERHLIEPFIEALDYNPLDFDEVETQPEDQFATTKVKCDYAIKKDGARIILIEAKKPSFPLDNASQLSTYFGLEPEVWLGIYTNGVEYRFYSGDIQAGIKRMDPESFLVLDLLNFDEADAETVFKFSKDQFDSDKVKKLAKERKFRQKYEKAISDALRKELEEPSEEFFQLLISKLDDAKDEDLERLKLLLKEVANQILNRPTPGDPTPVPFPSPSPPIGSNEDGIPVQSQRYKHSEPKKALLLRGKHGLIRLEDGTICKPSDAYMKLWKGFGNGWTKWEFIDKQSGLLRPINDLRGITEEEQIKKAGAPMGLVHRPSKY